MIIYYQKYKTLRKGISICLICLFLVNNIGDAFALAPAPVTVRPLTRCEYQIKILEESGLLKYAETVEDIDFLAKRNGALALLLPHGTILAHKDLKDKPEKLIRAIIHEGYTPKEADDLYNQVIAGKA